MKNQLILCYVAVLTQLFILSISILLAVNYSWLYLGLLFGLIPLNIYLDKIEIIISKFNEQEKFKNSK